MPKKPGASAYELASSIPGLSGLEVGGARLLDRANALASQPFPVTGPGWIPTAASNSNSASC
jgi:hypothetical protein